MAKTISGSDWMRGVGHKPVSVTLAPEVHERAGELADDLGVSKAQLGRAFFRWATDLGDAKKIRKILGKALDTL